MDQRNSPRKGWMQSVYKGTNASVEKPSNRQQERYLSRKIPVSKWIEYRLNLFRYVSLNADSWNNRNAISASKYWLEKVFLTLENSPNNVILEDTIWLDETYYSLIMRDKVRDENGNLLRGLSRNQICIGVATDKKHTICFVEGFGKPSQKRSYETFQKHIKPGSTLIHDKETTHKKLVADLGLNSVCSKCF